VVDEDAREEARQRTIADACLDASGAPEGRLGLYRRLVRGNLARVARRLLPRTAAALDETATSFDVWFARFLADGGPGTPYLRDVPIELVAWAEPRWRAAPEPPFLRDLARYEVDRFEMDTAPKAPSPPPLTEVALDRPLVFATPRRLTRYAYAVHEASAEPALRSTCLFLHRDADNTVHTTPIDRSAAELLELALTGVPLGEAFAQATASDDERRLAARWLAELGASGGLLGGQG
jgi:hypothetical protein